MKNLVISELERMISSRKNKILFILIILHVISSSMFVAYFKLGFYDPKVTVGLTSLNFPPFVIREIHFFLIFVVCPLMFIETFNAERTNGYYRMIMIRPYTKAQMFLSKWIVEALVFGILLFIIFIITTIYGFVFLPKASSAKFFNLYGNFTPAGAVLYNFRFFFYEYIVLLAILSINSLISVLMPNSVLAFLGSIVFCIGLVFVYRKLIFLILSSTSIFDTLSRLNGNLILYSFFIIVIGFVLSMVLFVKRDFKC